MNSILDKLHEKAMEFSDEGIIAKAKGDETLADYFFEKAYFLERDAALGYVAKDENTNLIKSILFRSAITLGLRCGYLWAAENLAKTALNSKPHPAIIEELKELVLKINTQKSEINAKAIQITGVITSADSRISEITVLVFKDKINLKVVLPHNNINEIVKSYWEKNIIIKGKTDNKGTIFLEKIKQAA